MKKEDIYILYYMYMYADERFDTVLVKVYTGRVLICLISPKQHFPLGYRSTQSIQSTPVITRCSGPGQLKRNLVILNTKVNRDMCTFESGTRRITSL